LEHYKGRKTKRKQQDIKQMVDKVQALLEYIRYQQRAQTKYYLHSPFVYQFYLNVLEGQQQFPEIEQLRAALLENKTPITLEDLGAKKGNYIRTIADIVSKAAISAKYGQVLSRLATYLDAKNILELGTSLGIGTAYLALSVPHSSVISIEGSPSIADTARTNLNTLGIQNATVLTGNFDAVLPEILPPHSKFDLIYIDGNHRYEPTLQYYHLLKNNITENGCIVLDDIYWSKEMTKAWQEIKQDTNNTLTLDIYRMGFVFFGKEKLAKEDFVLRY
jgi:predicted O-methyltransferase YrrM